MFKRRKKILFFCLCLVLAAGFFVWRQIPTYGGAIDSYAKEVMRAPQEYGLPGQPSAGYTYAIYNLQQPDKHCYECVLMIRLAQTAANEYPEYPAALQTIRVEKSGLLWQVRPQDDFQNISIDIATLWTIQPTQVYEAQYGDFILRVCRQFVGRPADNQDNPKTKFIFEDRVSADAIYTGNTEDKAKYTSISASTAQIETAENRPELIPPDDTTSIGPGGSFRSSTNLEGDWSNEISLGGGGESCTEPFPLPEAYALDFYINGELAAELTLLPVEN